MTVLGQLFSIIGIGAVCAAVALGIVKVIHWKQDMEQEISQGNTLSLMRNKWEDKVEERLGKFEKRVDDLQKAKPKPPLDDMAYLLEAATFAPDQSEETDERRMRVATWMQAQGYKPAKNNPAMTGTVW